MKNALKVFGDLHFASMLGRRGVKSPYSKKVTQYSMEGKKIKIWDGVREVSRVMGFNHQNIIHNLKGNTKHAYGFIWKYNN